MTLAKMSRGQKGEIGRESQGARQQMMLYFKRREKKDELFKFRRGKSFNFFPFIN
jgi:hypothetical protein